MEIKINWFHNASFEKLGETMDNKCIDSINYKEEQ